MPATFCLVARYPPTPAAPIQAAATAAKGEVALEHGAKVFVELLREIDRFDLGRLKEGPLPSSSPAKAGEGDHPERA